MPCQSDGQLVGEDVVLGFEVGRLEREDTGERRRWDGGVRRGDGGEEGVREYQLGEARGGKGVLGGYVERRAGEAVGGGELGGEEEG